MTIHCSCIARKESTLKRGGVVAFVQWYKRTERKGESLALEIP